MLSAVENHFGPNRSYVTGAHHYGPAGGNSGNNNLIAPSPIVALPAAAMNSAEFARPHPKTNRYNGSHSLRNGLSSSPRTKYSQLDQSAPVNLAVSQPSNENGLPMLHHKADSVLTAAAKPSSLESEQDAISSSIASLYQHKLAYCQPPPPAEAAAAAQSLYYSNYYGRPPTGAVYGAHMYVPAPPPVPSSHSLGNRNPMHHSASTYQTSLPDKFSSQICQTPHVDAYSNPYLFGATTYSPPAPTRPGLSPHSPIGALGSASVAPVSASQNSISANSSPLSISPPSIYTQQQQPQIQRESQAYHVKPSPQNEHLNATAMKIANSYRSEAKEKNPKLSHHQSNGKAVDFKIPSGKEGSLKHRILTRPFSEKDSPAKQKSAAAPLAPQTANSQNNVATKSSNRSNSSSNNLNNNNNVNSKNKNLNGANGISNFCKGTLIELSTGELKRVEDMRTEDFITSSSKNPNLQLVDTTVVRIAPKSKNMVVITLSYSNNKICIETQPGHPFFVYGKNWASFHPDETLREHGLKCQLLEVGDVCISLTPREIRERHQPKHSVQSMTENVAQAPQNLSRKQLPYTVSTTATSTAVTSRPIPAFDTSSSSYNHQLLSHRHPHPHPMQVYAQDRAEHERAMAAARSAQQLENAALRKYNAVSTMAPPPPPPSSNSVDSCAHLSHESINDEAIDATMHSSRKRRWSAPDNICDVNGCQLEQKKCKKH